MKYQIQVCDHCKKQIDSRESSELLIEVAVTTNHGYGNAFHLAQEWCNDCVRNAGLWPKYDDKYQVVETTQKMTLEDFIREIVVQQVSEVTR